MPKSKLSKDQLIEKLTKHFKKYNNSYFSDNILKILSIEDILKSFTVNNLNTLLGNIKDDLSQSPNGPAGAIDKPKLIDAYDTDIEIIPL